MLELEAERIGFKPHKKNQWIANKRGIRILMSIDEEENFPRYTSPTELIINSAIINFNGFDTALKAAEVLLNHASLEVSPEYWPGE